VVGLGGDIASNLGGKHYRRLLVNVDAVIAYVSGHPTAPGPGPDAVFIGNWWCHLGPTADGPTSTASLTLPQVVPAGVVMPRWVVSVPASSSVFIHGSAGMVIRAAGGLLLLRCLMGARVKH